jgi:S1-C subfamily serine protease
MDRVIILAVDGHRIAGFDDLQLLLTDRPIGSPLPISVLRGAERRELTVVPQEHQPAA